MKEREEAEFHAELAKKFFEEAEKRIDKGDAVQSSEKLYKCAEECVKALAILFSLSDVLEEVRKLGRWTSRLYHYAAREIEKRVEGFLSSWDAAWFLHTEGFHEARITIEDVIARKQRIEMMLKILVGVPS